MFSIRAALFVALGGFGAVFSAIWARQLAAARRRRGSGAAGGPDPATDFGAPSPAQLAIGFVTDFFDTLGIGSFAVTTSLFKVLRLVPDRLIPGTLLAGHSLPTLAEAFIYITIIQVDMTTLILAIAASIVGTWLGAGIVSRWPKRAIQTGMGIALLGAALIMTAGQLGLLPSGGGPPGLSGTRLVIGVVGNFALGALMTIGIGLYAPCLILFGLLGMDTRAIFPIMMGSCAFLMPTGGARFITRGSYALRPALGLTLGGLPGVFLAAYVVKALPLGMLKWLVIAVVVYAGATMLNSARKADPAAQ